MYLKVYYATHTATMQNERYNVINVTVATVLSNIYIDESV